MSVDGEGGRCDCPTDSDRCCVQEVTDLVRAVVTDNPLPEQVYAGWRQAAECGAASLDAGQTGAQYERGLKMWGAHPCGTGLSSPCLANVDEFSHKFGESRPLGRRWDQHGSRLSPSERWRTQHEVVSVLTRGAPRPPSAPRGPMAYGVSIFGTPFVVSKQELQKLYAAWTRESEHEFALEHDWYWFHPILFKRRFYKPFAVCGADADSKLERARTWTGPVELT